MAELGPGGVRTPPLLSTLPDGELRRVAVGAAACLRLEAARQYGLVTGGPEVDEDRCEDVLAYARERGIAPSQDEVDDATVGIVLECIAQADGP